LDQGKDAFVLLVLGPEIGQRGIEVGFEPRHLCPVRDIIELGDGLAGRDHLSDLDRNVEHTTGNTERQDGTGLGPGAADELALSERFHRSDLDRRDRARGLRRLRLLFVVARAQQRHDQKSRSSSCSSHPSLPHDRSGSR